MMKITGLSHLFKWENLHNWWLTKYFFAPLYFCIMYNVFFCICILYFKMQFISVVVKLNFYADLLLKQH